MTPFRLFQDRADWEGLPAKLADPFFAGIARTNRQALELLQPLPQGENLPRFLDDPSTPTSAVPWRVAKVRLARAGVAWWLERRDADRDHLLATIDHFFAEDWGVTPAYHAIGIVHFDLRTGDLAWKAAFILDVLAEVAGPQRCAVLARRVATELLPSYLRGVAAGEWWCACDFNWGGGTHAQAGLAALAIAEEHPALAEEVLDTVRRGLAPMIAAFPAHGAWIEGMMYQTTTLAHLSDFVFALERVSGDDLGLGGNPAFRDCIRYRQEQLGGDGRPLNFSNCNEHSIEHFLPQAYRWARRWNDPALTAFEDTLVKPWKDVHGLFHDVEAFWYRDAKQPAVARPTRSFHHFAGLDWLRWSQAAADRPAWWLALRGGRLGGNHGNLDLGQIILGCGTTRWLVDPGYGAGKTDQHNLPTVRGHQQTDRARGPIIRREQQGRDLHLAIDLHEAHPFVLDRWVRHVLVLDGSVVVLVDDLLGTEARRLSSNHHLQVRGDVALTGARATITQGDQRLDLTVHGEVTLAAKPWEWADQPLTTLTWRYFPDRCAHLAVTSFSVDGAAVSVEAGEGFLRLRLGDRTWTLDRVSQRLERPRV